MKNKSLNKLIRRIMWNNKGKIFIIALVLSIAISIFTSFGFANTFLQHNVDILKSNYKSYDFTFDKSKDIKDANVNKLASKYNFIHEQKEISEFADKIQVKGKSPIVHYDNNNSIGIKYLVSKDEANAKISKPFIIDGRWIKSDNEVVVLPQYLNVTNGKIGDNITLFGKSFKIVGTYSTPQYQKNIPTPLTSKNTYVIPVQMSQNAFAKYAVNKKSVEYATFNKTLSLSQREQMYERMKKENDFNKKVNFPQYKYVKKSLTYNKNKVCGDQKQIKQFEQSPELSVKQFNIISAMILQAQNGGECRSTLSNINISSKDANNLDYASKLGADSSSSISGSSTDLTPHYKTASLIPYSPSSYNYSEKVRKVAQQLSAEITDMFSKSKANFMGSGLFRNVAIDSKVAKYQNPETLMKEVENGLSNVELSLGAETAYANTATKPNHFPNPDKSKPDFDANGYMKYLLNLSNQPVPAVDVSKLKTIIQEDKQAFNNENQKKKAQIDSENAKRKAEVASWNASEDKRVAELKAAKAQGAEKLKQAQEQEKAKLEQLKKQQAEKNKKLGIVTSTFKVKVPNGNITKNVPLLDSIIDISNSITSKGIIEQMSKQSLISILLFLIFSILAALLIVIILQKIINDNKSEFGTLKALGIREKQISNKFISIPFITTFVSLIISSMMFKIIYDVLVKFLNENYYLPVSKFFKVDYFTLIFTVFVPVLILVAYTKISVKSLLSKKTLHLLNDVKSNNLVNGKSKFVKKMTTTMKLQYNTIRFNLDKSLIVLSCSFIITFLISLFVTMYFSSVETYKGVGKEITYDLISVKKNVQNEAVASPNNALMLSFEVDGLLNSKFDIIDQKDASKKVSTNEPISLNILGLNQLKTKSYDISNLDSKKLNTGIYLPAKYKSIYNIKENDLLKTTYNGKDIYIKVSGFEDSDENVFSFTSKTYLATLTDNIGKYNSEIKLSSGKMVEKDELFALDKNAATKQIFDVQKNIINIILIVAIIIFMIITPLIFILVSNIIDSNIKTIATLKAIGFNLSKIRSLIINPYMPVFIIGQVIGICVVGFVLGKVLIDTFFGYFGFDVIFHITLRNVILTMLSILAVYQLIIILSSQRINVVKTARILNEDSGQVRISKQDISQYFKTTSRSTFDLDRSKFKFKWKDVPSLTRKEKIEFIKVVAKKQLPLYIAQIINHIYQLGTAPFTLFVNNMLIPYTQFMNGVESVFSNIKQLDIVTTITSSSGTYKVQMYTKRSASGFRDVIRIEYMFTFASIIFQFVLLYLLGDIISNFFNLKGDQVSVLYLVAFSTSIVQLLEMMLIRFRSYGSMLENKPDAMMSAGQIFKQLATLVFSVLMWKWILANMILYVFVLFVINSTYTIIMYLVLAFTFRNHKLADYVNVKVTDMFMVDDWTLLSRVVKDSMPALQSIIIKLPLTFLSTLFTSKFTNTLITSSKEFVVFNNYANFITEIFNTVIPASASIVMTTIITRTLGREMFAKALQRVKFSRILAAGLSKSTQIFNILMFPILLIFIPLNGVALELIIISMVANLISVVFAWQREFSMDYLLSGGEFKYSNYVLVLSNTLLSSSIQIVLGILNLSQFAGLADSFSKSVEGFIFYARLKSGRWLRSTESKFSLKNINREFEILKTIELDKNNKYKYSNRNVTIEEDFEY